jgi:hypothetical protein
MLPGRPGCRISVMGTKVVEVKVNVWVNRLRLRFVVI